ncbi:hypothetical protein BRD56_06100 [Thermoplasmatales archaeon SW_10_69_26]|nr:MAG: hypothetical protein BRD56_06100 [Thermoplasmatales archaeon SW_10_69_26]
MRTTPILAAALLLAAALVGCLEPSPSSPPTGPIAFETVEKGQGSGVEDRKALEIRNDTAVFNLWVRHDPATNDHPDPPAVDFSQKTVLAVFEGLDASTCRSAEVTNVTGLDNGTIQAEWNLTPVAEEACEGGNGSAFHMVAIDRYDAEIAFVLED